MSLIATRQQIYSNEATDILHQISMYPGILEQQVCAFHPDKKAQVENLISYFIKQERIQREDNGSLYIIGCSPKPQKDVLIRSIWVLIDFLKDVEFHCAGDYPIMIVFLIKGKEYQIIYAEEYAGITRLGIEALLMKSNGMGVTEIARLYQVKPSHVGAWISRAKSKLKSNKQFLNDIAGG